MNQTSPATRHSSLQVLVVDDEESIVTICQIALRRMNLQVETAMTAAEAIAKARQSAFDLVLIDWILPDGNGLDLFRTLRDLSPQTLGILITGQSLAETSRDALEAGFWAALFKPFTVTELQATVQRAIDYLQAHRERERLALMVTLSDLARQIASSLDLDEVLHSVLKIAREQTGADRVSVMVWDDEAQPPCLRLVAAQGLPEKLLNQKVSLEEGIAGWVVKMGEPLLIAAQTISGLQAPLRYQGAGSALCFPLKVGNRVVGVLNLTRLQNDRPFSEADLHLYLILASQAALAIENARLHRRLREGHIAALASFARYAEAKEGYRRGHADRVGILCQIPRPSLWVEAQRGRPSAGGRACPRFGLAPSADGHPHQAQSPQRRRMATHPPTSPLEFGTDRPSRFVDGHRDGSHPPPPRTL